MKIQLRQFNDAGMAEFEKTLRLMRQEGSNLITLDFLTNETLSEQYGQGIEVELLDFRSRQDMAKYFFDLLSLDKNKNLYYDNRGLWSWLSAFYFEKFTRKKKDGTWQVREIPWYLLQEPKNHLRFYRHSLAYPCRLFSEMSDISDWMLETPPHKNNEVTEQIGAYQHLALNRAINSVARRLYYDPKKKSLKRNSASRIAMDGGVRRFVKVINQYRLNYYFDNMTTEEVLQILPQEFDRWWK